MSKNSEKPKNQSYFPTTFEFVLYKLNRANKMVKKHKYLVWVILGLLTLFIMIVK